MKVFIDAGHGGSDPGAVANGLEEKGLTLDIGRRIENILANQFDGISVKMGRTDDYAMSLSQRTNDANTWGADLFVSIHINAGGGTGYEDYRYNTLSASSNTGNIQSTIHQAVMAHLQPFGVTDRGAKSANFHVLRETNMPAVLTETLFIDTVGDADLLKRVDFLNAVATGHAEGIAQAFGLQRRAT